MNSTHPLSTPPPPPPNYDEAMMRSNEQTRLLVYTSNSNHTNHHHSQQEQQEQEPFSIDLSHEIGTYYSPFQFIRLLGFFSLILSTLFIIIISLSITRQDKIFNLNSYLFSHFSSFELPIYYSIISFLIIHLVLVNFNQSKSFSLIVHHTIHITQLNILIQVFLILFNRELRSKESGLTLFFATILLGSLDLANFIHSSTYSPQRRIPIIIHNLNRSFSFIRPLSGYLSRDQNHLTKTFKRLRFIGCSIFIILNTLILTISLLSRVSDLNPLPFNQLHTVEISLSPVDRHHHHYEEQVIETNLQMKCEWLNQLNSSSLSDQTTSHSNLPIYTKTILLFSPSSYTAKESSNWISSIKSFHDDDYLIGIRFCQFDRPGYDHSFNLPINKISDSVNVMDKVLNQIGEIDQIQKNWQGIGHSGFIVVGHGYGALEAKVFVSKHPQLVKSILYIDPETEHTFFNLDQDLTDSPFKQLSLSLHHMYKIFISSWKYTITNQLSLLPIHSISPSMTRAIIQESSIASSILAYDEFIQLTHSKHFPKHLKTKVISNPHQKDQNQFKALEICIDFMQSTCQETLIDLVND